MLWHDRQREHEGTFSCPSLIFNALWQTLITYNLQFVHFVNASFCLDRDDHEIVTMRAL